MAEQEDDSSAQKWLLELDLAKKTDAKWVERSRKIVKRFRDEREGTAENAKKYNILWSNVRTLSPAVYSKRPKAYVARRYKDRDPIARAACQMLQRAIQYELDFYNDYDSAMRNAVQDRLLPGRGVAWVRFEPHLAPAPPEASEGVQVTDDTKSPEHGGYECTPVDYVFWEDFRCSPARTWEEVTWVARRVYMGKEEGEARFGEKFEGCPLSHMPVGVDDYQGTIHQGQIARMKKAKVWEIWNKTDGTVEWVAESFEKKLDSKPDPLKLEGFFPCPKPLFATLTTDQLVPVPDYAEYQDQAQELDEVTNRISMLVKACKVVGVYDASSKAVGRIFTEGVDNDLIPVDSWAMFAEKGGLKGQIDWVPIEMVTNALQQLYAAREQIKQVIYEVTGISDILRGASQAQETLGAQQIKAQFASMRLEDMKKDVARFASDIIRIKAQIMCSLYRPETLVKMSGILSTQDAKYVEQAIQLVRDEPLRNFRIEVSADSLVEMDEMSERQDRMQFLQAAGAFLKEAIPASQQVPEIAPLMGEMLMFAVRSWKTAEPIEEAFDEALAKLGQPKPPPPPNPEVIKAQADAQKAQAEAQVKMVEAQNAPLIAQAEAQKAQAEIQASQAEAFAGAQTEAAKEQAKVAMEQVKQQAETERAQMQLQFDRWKAELEAATKIEVANIGAAVKVNDTATKAATAEIGEEVQNAGDPMAEVKKALTDLSTQMGDLQKKASAKRIKTPERGPDGRISRVIETLEE
jgi:hypothetical protein